MANCHPLLENLLETCVRHHVDESRAHLTFQVYMELCEGLKLWAVEHHFNEQLKLFYLTARKSKHDEDREIYVPVTISQELSILEIQRLQNVLCSNIKSLNLAISDGDSSATFYKITAGLVKPDPPLVAQSKKEDESRCSRFEAVIAHNKKSVYAKALKNSQNEKEIGYE